MTAKTKKQPFKRIYFQQGDKLAERCLYAVEKTKDGYLRLFMDGNEVYTCQRVFHNAPLDKLSADRVENNSTPDTNAKCKAMKLFDLLPDNLTPASIRSVKPMEQDGLARCIATASNPNSSNDEDTLADALFAVLENNLQGFGLYEIRSSKDSQAWACVLLGPEPYSAQEREQIHGTTAPKKRKRKATSKGGRDPQDGEKTIQAARDALAAMRKNPHLSLKGACIFQVKEHGLTVSGRAVERHARKIRKQK